jgi:Holliday junction resolvasome RuvABC endonuclease subunit
MVSNNRVKAYLTGNRNAKKKEVRAALQKRFEVQLKTPGFRKNEHTFDALGVAVTYLEDVR